MSNGTRSGSGGPPQGASTASLTVGRVLALIGLVVCIPAGLYLISIAMDSLGIVLGVVGYFLGSRRLGVVTVVLGVAAMVFGLLTQGYPGGPGS